MSTSSTDRPRRHMINIFAHPHLYQTGRAYAEISEQGVHRSRRVKMFKSRSVAATATDDVYYKACEWARANGYTQWAPRADVGWFSIWTKEVSSVDARYATSGESECLRG